ncbi:MAG: FtsX-like permease family protein, partial [Acidobacteria bacterium]
IRMALGAPRGAIARLMLGRGLAVTGAGIAAGLAVGSAAARPLTMFLPAGMSAFDPFAFAVAPALLLAAGLAARAVPMRRALRVEPITALRQD